MHLIKVDIVEKNRMYETNDYKYPDSEQSFGLDGPELVTTQCCASEHSLTLKTVTRWIK